MGPWSRGAEPRGSRARILGASLTRRRWAKRMLRRVMGPRRRLVLLYLADSAVLASSVVVATIVRLDFDLDLLNVRGALGFAALAVAIGVGFGTLTGLYNGSHRLASFDEVVALASSAAAVTILLTLVDYFPRPR